MRGKKREHYLNDEIRSHEVRIIGQDESYIVGTKEATQKAKEEGKDLILINDKPNPPIAMIEDYNKFLYDKEKKEKERRKNAVKNEMKEIRLSADIGEGDLETKAKKAREFLSKGNKVRCNLRLKGRQKAMPERGEKTMLIFASMVQEFGNLESMPSYEKSKWNMIIKPKKSP